MFMRQGLSHIVLYDGGEPAFAEYPEWSFILYSENIEQLVREYDIDETVFHEAVLATLEADYAERTDWIVAQQSDGAYVTRYAADFSKKEELAESALFTYTLLYHPRSLPGATEQAVKTVMSNRLAYLSAFFKDLESTKINIDRPSPCPS